MPKFLWIDNRTHDQIKSNIHTLEVQYTAICSFNTVKIADSTHISTSAENILVILSTKLLLCWSSYPTCPTLDRVLWLDPAVSLWLRIRPRPHIRECSRDKPFPHSTSNLCEQGGANKTFASRGEANPQRGFAGSSTLGKFDKYLLHICRCVTVPSVWWAEDE